MSALAVGQLVNVGAGPVGLLLTMTGRSVPSCGSWWRNWP